MSREMTKITVYKCKWCGRYFKTPTLHQCKFDPDLKNCLSCRHNAGCRKGEWEEGEYTPSSIICPFHAPDDGGGCNEFPMAKGNLQCPHHELLEGYDGSKTFAKHRDYVDDGYIPDGKEKVICGELTLGRSDIFRDKIFVGSYDTQEEAAAVVKIMNDMIAKGEMYVYEGVEIKTRRYGQTVFENPVDVSNRNNNKRRKEFS